MTKTEMFDAILDEVCQVCEVKKECILDGTRIQSVVDARILSIQYIRRLGLSNDDIALIVMREVAGDATLCPDMKTLKQKAKGIDKAFKNYSDRCLQSKAFRLMSYEINQFCNERFSEDKIKVHIQDTKG